MEGYGSISNEKVISPTKRRPFIAILSENDDNDSVSEFQLEEKSYQPKLQK